MMKLAARNGAAAANIVRDTTSIAPKAPTVRALTVPRRDRSKPTSRFASRRFIADYAVHACVEMLARIHFATYSDTRCVPRKELAVQISAPGMTALRQSDAVALTRTEVAKLFGVDERTITAAVARGELPSVRLGRRVFIPREQLLALLTPSNRKNDAIA